MLEISEHQEITLNAGEFPKLDLANRPLFAIGLTHGGSRRWFVRRNDADVGGHGRLRFCVAHLDG